MTALSNRGPTDASVLGRRYLGPAIAVCLVGLTALLGLLFVPRLSSEMVVGFHVDLGGDVSLTRAPRIVAVLLLSGISAVVATGYLVARWLDARADGGQYRRDIDVIGLLAVLVACAGQLLLLVTQF